MSELTIGGYVVSVDAPDMEAVLLAGPWHVYQNGYSYYVARSLRINGKRSSERLHNFLTGWKSVDHIDGDGLNNRRENLRAASQRQNMQNRRTNRDNKSGCRGVSIKTGSRGRWVAQIKVSGEVVHLGYYTDKADACRAARLARAKHFAYDNPSRNQCEHKKAEGL